MGSPLCFKGEQFLLLSVCLSGCDSLSNTRSTPKRKNLLQEEQIFSLRVGTLLKRETKIKNTEKEGKT